MTLVEVLVAMTILLVGIWGVAVGFPRLLGLIREEDRRTQMTRLAHATLQSLAADPQGLPELISVPPDLTFPGNVSPLSVPQDPESLLLSDNPFNARDDWLAVTGERAVIPSLQPGASLITDVIYPLKLGRAHTVVDPADPHLRVREIALVEEPAVLTADPLLPGQVHLDSDGSLRACVYATPADQAAGRVIGELELNYSWRDIGGGIHHVRREILALPTPPLGETEITLPVQAVQLTGVFDTAVGGSAFGYSRTYLAFGGAGASALPGEFKLDPTGAMLLFNRAESGVPVEIDYHLQRDPVHGRRVPEMWEDQFISWTDAVDDPGNPAYSFVTVQLTANGIHGEEPLLNVAPETRVLAIDKITGLVYAEGSGLEVDYNRARVSLRVPDTALGHPFRFFYRTVDDAMLTIAKPAEWYWSAEQFDTPEALNPWRHRVYMPRWLPLNGTRYRVLDFTSGLDPITNQPTSASAGMTISVDYLYGSADNPQRVIGELHTIPVRARSSEADRAFSIALNQPEVLSILAVRGVSLKVRGWWRADTGRLQYVDVDTLSAPLPLG